MRFIPVFILTTLLISCNGFNKILKNPDPAYKLRMAEQYYVKKKYNNAQELFDAAMPYYKGKAEFEDIYYKYAYCAYYQKDYMNAENLFKNYLEAFPSNSKVEEVSYMRAYCYYKESPKPSLDQTSTVKAMEIMRTFINLFPNSTRIKEATEIIDICRGKLEEKERLAAELYFNVGQYRAAGVAYNSLINNYPDSEKGDEYKLMVIKSFYKFAQLSVEERKAERFEQVVSECNDFYDRFPESKLMKEVEQFQTLSQNNIKNSKS